MSNERRFTEVALLDYAFGGGDIQTRAAILEQIRNDPASANTVHEARALAAALAIALPQETPGAGVRQRLFAQLPGADQVPAQQHIPALPDRPARGFSFNWLFAFAATAAVAALLLIADLSLLKKENALQQQVASLETRQQQGSTAAQQQQSNVEAQVATATQSLDGQAARLQTDKKDLAARQAELKAQQADLRSHQDNLAARETAVAALERRAASAQALLAAFNAPGAAHFLLTKAHAKPAPQIQVAYQPSSGKVVLSATALAPLPAGKTYELWWLGDPAPTAAGLFQPDAHGSVQVFAESLPTGLPVKGFAVTVEDSGGSNVPTPPIVLASGQ